MTWTDEPLASGLATVDVAYHMFYLAEPDTFDPNPVAAENGLVFSRRGIAVVITGASSGLVNVAVEVYPRTPKVTDFAGWDDVVDHSFHAHLGRVQVVAPVSDLPDLPCVTPSGPGHYRLRVHARGRDNAPDAVAFEPAEDYLVQVWPHEPQPDLVHRQTDLYGAQWRETNAGRN
ncbi:hypothetical protein [Streptomyces sp. SID3343]|uniref:hypothetical protein n=1 Tax=Streptomyces sp. SID3343 TaxID=2690260 RepID=UPI0013695B5C|nr:hypothetical protein [Streptomyces sp. SID3343]MYV98390.1 hypothetical protein [Streptomyces sp. SID3343]